MKVVIKNKALKVLREFEFENLSEEDRKDLDSLQNSEILNFNLSFVEGTSVGDVNDILSDFLIDKVLVQEIILNI
jgi:hypothetical protein